MNISIRFARKYNTSPGTYWEIVYWREKKLPVKDIRILLIQRGLKITISSTKRWAKKAEKTLKKQTLNSAPKEEKLKPDKNGWIKL